MPTDGSIWLDDADGPAPLWPASPTSTAIPCLTCGLKQALTFETNVDLDSGLRVCRDCRDCRDCRSELDLLAAGEWIADAPGNRIRGYHISRLYAPWANVPDLIEASTATTPAALQQFYNSDLGETYSPPGGGLSPDELDRDRRNYLLDDYHGQRCDIGVDVGLKLHVVIREHPSDPSAERRLWFAGQVEWTDLDALLERFHILQCVIDAQPEMNLAKEFALRHRSTTWTAYYSRREAGMSRQKGDTTNPNIVHLNRTESLDAVAEQVRDQTAVLPRDARQLGGRFKDREGYGEYYRELLASERRFETDANGQLVARWDHRRRDDHYAHAEAYCRVASQSSIGGRRLGVRSF